MFLKKKKKDVKRGVMLGTKFTCIDYERIKRTASETVVIKDGQSLHDRGLISMRISRKGFQKKWFRRLVILA